MHICVLIPTYNEKENLEKLIPQLYTAVYSAVKKITFSTLVVDDNSHDGTRELLTRFMDEFPHLSVSYGEKQGIGKAMQRGYQYAMNHLHPDAIATLEADYVVDPMHLLKMATLLSGNDVILASRSNESAFYSSMPLKHLAHFGVNTVVCEWIAGLMQTHDHTAACRIIRVRGVLDTIDLNSLPTGYAFFPAILYQVARRGVRFADYQVAFLPREIGQSKFNPRNIPVLFKESRDYLLPALRYRFTRKL